MVEGADNEVLGGWVIGDAFWVEVWGSEIDVVGLSGLG